jgi:hypothetical protein
VNLREQARGKSCKCRCPGYCNGDTATTVLAHVRMIGISAMSMKAPDFFAADACSGCHDFLDGRVPSLVPYEQRRSMLLEGMIRTQHERLASGEYVLTEAEVSR